MNGSVSLAGRKAFVTGGASGLGEAAAKLFTDLGAEVFICDINADGIDAAVARTGAKGAGIGDIASLPDVDRMVAEAVAALGSVDLVFNSAGIGDDLVPMIEQDPERWQRVIDVNLRGTYLVCRATGMRMIADNVAGSIVNVSSICGLGGFPRRTAYGAAKAAVGHFTRTLACEWGKHAIRVNCIAPGYIRTPMVADLLERKMFDEKPRVMRTPLERMGLPDEIARTAAFLMSDWASYITGAEIPVDGGWSAFGAVGDVASA
jgi:NAD(P)-dependent dehydrogenase (short-subunit alcohol dehydrogenase family)